MIDPTTRSAIAQRLDPAVSVEKISFEPLRGVSVAEVVQKLRSKESLPEEERKLFTDLQEILLLTKISMTQMNAQFPALPPDSIATTLDLISRSGATVVVLRGQPLSQRRDATPRILGYGITIKGIENCPDRELIPARFSEPGAPVIHRAIRAFVTEDARLQLGPGAAFSFLFDGMAETVQDGEVMLGRALTDVIPLGWDPEPHHSKQPWLEAVAALKKRGWEILTDIHVKEVTHRDERTVAIPLALAIWPPQSQAGQELYQEYQNRFEKMEARQRERFAGILPELPIWGGLVHYFGTSTDAFTVASALPGSVTKADVFLSADPRDNRGGTRANLITSLVDDQISLPPRHATSVVVNGVMPDIVGNSSCEEALSRLQEFLDERIDSLKIGGKVVIRNPVAPSPNEKRVIIELNSHVHPEFCKGKTLSEVFDEFVESGTERFITDQEWGSVTPRESTDPDFVAFEVPTSIAYEFCAKYRYYADWSSERSRPYTVIDAQEILYHFAERGLREIRSQEERSRYLAEQFDESQLLKIFSTEGERLPSLPSNHLIVAQKVSDDAGLFFSRGETLSPREDPFVTVQRFEVIDPRAPNTSTGSCEIGIRKNATLDVVPYCVQNQLYVLGRQYPRPLLVNMQPLDDSRYGGFLFEQLGAIKKPDEIATSQDTERAALQVFEDRAGRNLSGNESVPMILEYLSSPETVDERIRAAPIRVPLEEFPFRSTVIQDTQVPFVGHYETKAVDAMALLQSAQVGASLDPRIERIVYPLLKHHGISAGPWIAARLALTPQRSAQPILVEKEKLLQPPEKFTYRLSEDAPAIEAEGEDRRLEVTRQEFFLHTTYGMRSTILESIAPAPETGFGVNEITVLYVAKQVDAHGSERIIVGLEPKASPAAQRHYGHSTFASVSTVQMPLSVSPHQAKSFARQSIEGRLDLKLTGDPIELGGKFVDSPGVTAKTTYPLIAEVALDSMRNPENLMWYPLEEIVPLLPEIRCGLTMTSLWRAAHMYGCI